MLSFRNMLTSYKCDYFRLFSDKTHNIKNEWIYYCVGVSTSQPFHNIHKNSNQRWCLNKIIFANFALYNSQCFAQKKKLYFHCAFVYYNIVQINGIDIRSMNSSTGFLAKKKIISRFSIAIICVGRCTLIILDDCNDSCGGYNFASNTHSRYMIFFVWE